MQVTALEKRDDMVRRETKINKHENPENPDAVKNRIIDILSKPDDIHAVGSGEILKDDKEKQTVK